LWDLLAYARFQLRSDLILYVVVGMIGCTKLESKTGKQDRHPKRKEIDPHQGCVDRQTDGPEDKKR